ncbi:thiamin pyrophosphokinase 1 isoform X5 [Pieris brassicae]|uniref:thiamin pyrophosphokinase 1 isoform X5 n=1 Tax=Pieris brassicae TaxID=7116 RepID=UPI001E661024|nr:thiamin pyrophosphokinase 1 isoform X5 [Pieris brassicae]
MTANGIVKKKLPCNTISNVIKCWQWDISPFIENVKQNGTKYAVVILNRPITQKQDFVKCLWNNATVRVTVDGGTTHWNNFYKSLANEDNKNIKLPDLITGDFDSITQDVLQEFKKKGCEAVHTPDQNFTDFTKALIELNNYNEQHKIEETRTFKRSWCSLVPVGECCDAVTTSGLKWNLNNQPLKFGSLVSTSNTFDRSELVKIKCSHTLLWSMRVPSLTEKQRKKQIDLLS